MCLMWRYLSYYEYLFSTPETLPNLSYQDKVVRIFLGVTSLGLFLAQFCDTYLWFQLKRQKTYALIFFG